MRIRRQRSSTRSLPRRATRPPARFLPGAPARPSPKMPAGPLPGPHQPSLHRRSHAAASPNQLGRHLRGNMQLPGQLSKRLRGGMQIFVKTLPPRHLSFLPAYMAPHASLARARVKARRSGDGRDGPRPRPRLSEGTPKPRIKCVLSYNASDKLIAL